MKRLIMIFITLSLVSKGYLQTIGVTPLSLTTKGGGGAYTQHFGTGISGEIYYSHFSVPIASVKYSANYIQCGVFRKSFGLVMAYRWYTLRFEDAASNGSALTPSIQFKKVCGALEGRLGVGHRFGKTESPLFASPYLLGNSWVPEICLRYNFNGLTHRSKMRVDQIKNAMVDKQQRFEVEHILNDLGYSIDMPLDGYISVKETKQIAKFKKDQGLSKNGKIDYATIDRVLKYKELLNHKHQ